MKNCVVPSRSILGLGLPSSANGNCEWPLPVHWNCLFVTNQGAFNVSHVSGRSALIYINSRNHSWKKTRNAWQSLANSPLGAVVSPLAKRCDDWRASVVVQLINSPVHWDPSHLIWRLTWLSDDALQPLTMTSSPTSCIHPPAGGDTGLAQPITARIHADSLGANWNRTCLSGLLNHGA